MDVVDEYIAGMIERGEVDLRAVLDRPGAVRYLSPEKVRAALEWLREYAIDHCCTEGVSSPVPIGLSRR